MTTIASPIPVPESAKAFPHFLVSYPDGPGSMVGYHEVDDFQTAYHVAVYAAKTIEHLRSDIPAFVEIEGRVRRADAPLMTDEEYDEFLGDADNYGLVAVVLSDGRVVAYDGSGGLVDGSDPDALKAVEASYEAWLG